MADASNVQAVIAELRQLLDRQGEEIAGLNKKVERLEATVAVHEANLGVLSGVCRPLVRSAFSDHILVQRGWDRISDSRGAFVSKKAGELSQRYGLPKWRLEAFFNTSKDRNVAAHRSSLRAVAHFFAVGASSEVGRKVFEREFGMTPEEYLESGANQPIEDADVGLGAGGDF
ncbi:hypothetical protein TWF696_003194 [Orbilia brochopaga]|uniref:AraC family transcriptional regulator n=1 Tax=Orbilia brochopaga TaxID=3140254 RepID=A0AAV9TY31_9PEZI